MKKIYIGFGLNGVNADRYNGWDGKLNAAEYDIHDMGELAHQIGFFAVKQYFGEDATIQNLREAFKWARKQFRTEGGLLWFNFSGHGGQLLNHETLCLYDQQMLDTSIVKELRSFNKAVRVVAMYDCCHSGGLDKGLGLFTDFDVSEYRIKAMDPDVAILAADNVESRGVARVPKGESVVKCLMACQKDQSAYDGKRNGVFTAAVKAVFAKQSRGLDYQTLIGETTNYIVKMQLPRLVTVPNVDLFADTMNVFL